MGYAGSRSVSSLFLGIGVTRTLLGGGGVGALLPLIHGNFPNLRASCFDGLPNYPFRGFVLKLPFYHNKLQATL